MALVLRDPYLRASLACATTINLFNLMGAGSRCARVPECRSSPHPGPTWRSWHGWPPKPKRSPSWPHRSPPSPDPSESGSGTPTRAGAADTLERSLRALPNVTETIRYLVGPSVAAHTGAGTFGAVFHPI